MHTHTQQFLYDIYFVFLSPGGVMESVATSLEGPVKLLSPRAAAATAPGQYPFSILGLGDIVVPGLFVGMYIYVYKCI
jgi:minor histocompatibility antigen H13